MERQRLSSTKVISNSRKPRDPLVQSMDAKGSGAIPQGFEGGQTYNRDNAPILPRTKGTVGG